MKNFLIPSLMVFILACSETDDPKPAECQPVEIEEFTGIQSTFYYFNESINGRNLLSEVSFAPGTEIARTYTYEYLSGRLDKIARDQGGSTINYSTTFEGEKLTKLSGIPFGFGIVLYEISLTYSGDNITRWEESLGDDATGILYPYRHFEYTYDGSNLNMSKYYIDDTVIDALNKDEIPSAYSPELEFSIEYGYGSQEAPNALYRQYNLQNPEISLLVNVPTTLVQRNVDGIIIGSLGYDITFNDEGFPTLANSGNAYLDFTYTCN